MFVKTPQEALHDLAAALPEHHCDQHVGERVAKRLEELGLNHWAIMTVGGHYVSLPTNTRRRPSLHNILRFAILLDINPEYLAWGRGGKRLTPRMQEYILRLLGLERSSVQAAIQAARQARRTERAGPS